MSVPVVALADGIGFADELSVDRDQRGVLWVRESLGRGQGRPMYNRVHALRQRRSMLRMLCQVCGEPADRNEVGWLWLLHDDRAIEPGDWPERVGASHPPLCLPCAKASTVMCPHLAGGSIAVRVAEAPVVGVRGLLYSRRPGRRYAQVQADVLMPYADPAVRWVLAAQMLRLLKGCTVVDLDAELAKSPHSLRE